MPSEPSLADYLDDALPEIARSAVEESLVHDPTMLREIVAQEQMAAALRMLLGGAAEHEQIKRSIIADISTDAMSKAKGRVLADMTAHENKKRGRRMEWWLTGISLAAAAVIVSILTLWHPRVTPIEMAHETPAPIVPKKPEMEKNDLVPPKPPAPDATPVVALDKPKTIPDPQPSPKQPDMPLIAQNNPATPAMNNPATPDKPVMPPIAANVSVTPPPVKPVAPVEIVALRDAAEWPFASDSAWNQPIGSGAKYAPVRFAVREKFAADKTGIRWRPILRDVANGAAYRVVEAGKEVAIFHLDVPADKFKGNDQPVCILDRAGTSVLELRDADFTQPGVITAKLTRSVDLKGPGFSGGVAESGCSALGGVVRAGEMTSGIHHALAMAVNIQWLSLKGGKLHVWPATTAAYPTKSFIKPGNVQFGTLLAIPQGVSLEKLNVGAKGTPGYELAKALQDHGAYVTETCRWQQFHFYFADDNMPPNLAGILARLAKELHVVTNNTPTTPAGGGKPSVKPAPELAK